MRRHSTILLLITLAAAACGQGVEPVRPPEIFARHDAVTVVCAGGATVAGFDVSTWQGTIDWDAVANSGQYGFAIARISDGDGYYDNQFDRNWSEMKRVGLIRGAYQFFEPSEDAASQANLVVRVVGQLGPGDLPVTVDVETATPTPDELWTWINIVQQGTGKTPIVYTAYGLWNGWISGGFESLPLWAANYGASCPGMPANWGNWTFWQYADNTGVPGISGNVDGDVFNGSMSDLQAFSNAVVDQQPIGYLDVADCDSIGGWAQDPDAPTQAINADVYFGGPAGSGAPGMRLLAGDDRADLCGAIGSCNHGYSVRTPRSLMDGASHDIHVYGIDTGGGTNPELSNSPRALVCAPSETGVLRHVIDPTSYQAWGFDSFMDLRNVADTDIAGWTRDADWPAAPQLMRGDSTPEVWVVDGSFKRHVVDPTSAADWHIDLSSVPVVPQAQADAIPQGPDLRYRPQLVVGSDGAVYELDDAPPVVAPTDAGATTQPTDSDAGQPDAVVDAGTHASFAPDAGSSLGSVTGSGPNGGPTIARTAQSPKNQVDGGCASASGSSLLALFALALLGVRRRA